MLPELPGHPIGRITVPDFPHHVTQRGNRRQRVFFEPPDYALYRDLLAKRCRMKNYRGLRRGAPEATRIAARSRAASSGEHGNQVICDQGSVVRMRVSSDSW